MHGWVERSGADAGLLERGRQGRWIVAQDIHEPRRGLGEVRGHELHHVDRAQRGAVALEHGALPRDALLESFHLLDADNGLDVSKFEIPAEERVHVPPRNVATEVLEALDPAVEPLVVRDQRASLTGSDDLVRAERKGSDDAIGADR